MAPPHDNEDLFMNPSLPRLPSRVVELRQYTMQPGRRDELITLFEREFIEGQEATGIEVIGSFRDLDDANRFVWLRGLADMDHRPGALSAFYDGPLWKANRDAANATMVDSDDVLLLRPAHPSLAFAVDPAERAPRGATGSAPGVITATVCLLHKAPDAALVELFRMQAQPLLTRLGAKVIGCLTSEPSPNNYPRLPVRREHALVWFCAFADTAAERAHADARRTSRTWHHEVRSALCADAIAPPQVLRLAPTARSSLHG